MKTSAYHIFIPYHRRAHSTRICLHFTVTIYGLYPFLDSEPITSTEVYETIEYSIKQNQPVISIVISKQKPPSRTNLLALRAIFDQIQQYPKKITNCAITNPTRPVTPKYVKDFIKTGLKQQWMKSLFENYSKNAQVAYLYRAIPNQRCTQKCQNSSLSCQSLRQGPRS